MTGANPLVIVSGTGRCGTSMWMQALGAAGVTLVGEAFPLDWEQTSFREANEDGFFESGLAGGINHTSHPDPFTAATLPTDRGDAIACKLFLRGLPLTERRWLTHVVVTVRRPASYQASLARARTLLGRPAADPRAALCWWWLDHFAALRDANARDYPMRWTTYEQVLAEPERTVGPIFDWLGLGEQAWLAVGAIRPERRTQPDASTLPDLPEPWVAPFEELYARVLDGTHQDRRYLAGQVRFAQDLTRWLGVAGDPWRKRRSWGQVG